MTDVIINENFIKLELLSLDIVSIVAKHCDVTHVIIDENFIHATLFRWLKGIVI